MSRHVAGDRSSATPSLIRPFGPALAHRTLTGTALAVALLLSACGGGSEHASNATTAASTADAEADSGPVTAAAEADGLEILPTYHMAPVLPDAPSDIDTDGLGQSANMAPMSLHVPASRAALSTARLNPEQLRSSIAATAEDSDRVSAAATGTTAKVYTPAQIRAAYGFPTLPTITSGLTAAAAANLGAGQTIYIVDAYHHPNIAKDLAAFNAKFGLPTCTTTVLTATSKLPLVTPSPTSGCALTVAYSTSTGTLSSTAPAYNAGWATEIALDVLWAHAIAPMARIVLIEAPNASVGALANAVNLAANMGAGTVSMSFGAVEGSWTSSVDSVFKRSGMSYFAASGDWGTQVNWPAVSANVISVGGTSLNYTGGSARTETAWSGSGGGTSVYVAMPAHQTYVAVPGKSTTSPRRAGPDVAYNANPYTGHYVYFTPSGSTTGAWYVVGGTSASAPQWAATQAIARAKRAAAGKTLLNTLQTPLYKTIGAVSTTYASAFLDVTSGTNGTCSTCSAGKSYDLVTGLGTPNASSLLTVLTAY